MVEAVGQNQLPHFTTLKYTTKDGENISATKNNGVVTLVGDKNGVRQMPMEDFKKELVTNVAQPKLEKSPEKDTVEISKTPAATEAKAPEEAKAVSANNDKTEKAEPANNAPAPAVAEQGKKLDVAA